MVKHRNRSERTEKQKVPPDRWKIAMICLSAGRTIVSLFKFLLELS